MRGNVVKIIKREYRVHRLIVRKDQIINVLRLTLHKLLETVRIEEYNNYMLSFVNLI